MCYLYYSDTIIRILNSDFCYKTPLYNLGQIVVTRNQHFNSLKTLFNELHPGLAQHFLNNVLTP